MDLVGLDKASLELRAARLAGRPSATSITDVAANCHTRSLSLFSVHEAGQYM